MPKNRIARCAGMLLCLAAPAAAEEPVQVFGTPVALRPGDPPIDVYGLGVHTSVVQVSQWQAVVSGITWQQAAPGYLSLTAGTSFPALHAPIVLEPGAKITQVCVQAYDNTAGGEVGLVFGAFESANATGTPYFTALEGVATGLAAMPRYTLLCAAVSPEITIRTSADLDQDGTPHTAQYWLGVSLPTGTATAVGPAVITWQRTVSPAPALATFTDVAVDSPYFKFVEALAASGISAGCGGGRFCPDATLTRKEMAVFLAVALGLHWPN